MLAIVASKKTATRSLHGQIISLAQQVDGLERALSPGFDIGILCHFEIKSGISLLRHQSCLANTTFGQGAMVENRFLRKSEKDASKAQVLDVSASRFCLLLSLPSAELVIECPLQQRVNEGILVDVGYEASPRLREE